MAKILKVKSFGDLEGAVGKRLLDDTRYTIKSITRNLIPVVPASMSDMMSDMSPIVEIAIVKTQHDDSTMGTAYEFRFYYCPAHKVDTLERVGKIIAHGGGQMKICPCTDAAAMADGAARGQGYISEDAEPDPPELPVWDHFAGAVRMFRVWKWKMGHGLGALTNEHIWKPGENRAKHVSHGSGGFYGFMSWTELLSQESGLYEDHQNFICGTVLAYGRIQVGTRGARAQYAIPEYLIVHPSVSTEEYSSLAKHYGMTLINTDQAENLQAGLVPYQRPEEK